ncbi:conserved hypothetical protein [Pediculus humanus corporis]|uniref:Uncharacterized protein n=1 Tax=Pediculus humanus subsp. corporis TaxID=121224 RepID=E0W3C6_PEDHC|nr:uncharacterized protein Phum_PHUM603220 [Pediculus humanus corporis]EEB20132.1 conserved hypothetical protein [Pediculus humanus corporis]
MLTSLAEDWISRGTTNSKVISLNLTNLFILMILKAIVFGAGAFGFGPQHYNYGRSSSSYVDDVIRDNGNFFFKNSKFLTESELLMMLGYLRGDKTQDYDCMKKIACLDPIKAEEYAFTGRLFLKGYQYLTEPFNNTKYLNALSHMDEAINYGISGRNCMEKYTCRIS